MLPSQKGSFFSLRLRWYLLMGLLVTASCEAEIYHHLNEKQANEALSALREGGIECDKVAEGSLGPRSPGLFRLTVSKSDEVRAIRLLSQMGLPRPALVRPEAQGSSILQLPAERERERIADLAADLAVTLERLPNVQEARVHLVPKPSDPLVAQTESEKARASVLLLLRGDPLGDGQTPDTSQIRALVLGAVPNLDRDMISVTLARVPRNPTASGMMGDILVKVGPLWVARGSQRLASVALALVCLLGAALLFLGVYLVRRSKAG